MTNPIGDIPSLITEIIVELLMYLSNEIERSIFVYVSLPLWTNIDNILCRQLKKLNLIF